MTPAPSFARDQTPPEGVLQQLRIPFVRRVTLVSSAGSEEAFMIDIGLAGAFIERAEPMPVGQTIEIHVPWPGSEIPFRASCRVAWWHPEGAPLASKSLPPGAGLQFVDMSPADRDRLRGLLVDYCRQNPRVRRFLRHWPDAERQGDDPTAG
jgi:Tfp pilus assembly protein PilZ